MSDHTIAIVAPPAPARITARPFARPRDRAAPPSLPSRPLRIALIEPRYDPTFFGQDHLMPLLPHRPTASHAGGALPLLAAFVQPPDEVTLFNENLAPLDFARLAEYDIVGLTGMIVQRRRMLEILHALRSHPGLIVVGGPYASVDERCFEGLCDVLFVGEADESWPAFLAALREGPPWAVRHEQATRTDMTRVPMPRYDLLDARDFMVATLQFSRGCPFLCEFCDIITIFGRQPRAKRPAQVIAELEALHARGFRAVFLVDDNFIGNKKLARELLVELVVWQRTRGRPLVLGTEASINLADEPELLELMYEANFRSVFVGIESPNLESLGETRKVQNVRGDGLVERVLRIRAAGLIVEGGFMVGFDNDGPDIFERQYEFIQASRIARAAVGILTAIPSTPLFERLEATGRLRLEDPDCNFAPAQMTSAELRAGYLELNRRLYEPEAYFERALGVWNEEPELRRRWSERAAQDRGTGAWLVALGSLRLAARLLLALVQARRTGLAPRYWRLWRAYRRRGVPGIAWPQFVSLAAWHWHAWRHYDLARQGGMQVINTYAYSSSEAVSGA